MKVYENIAKHKTGKSNWQTHHNAAFMMIGGALNRADLVRQAIEDPQHGFHYQMKASVLPDGMWAREFLGVSFLHTRRGRTDRRNGSQVGHRPVCGDAVKEMHTVALAYRMADGTLPRFGDATTTRIPGSRYEAAYHHWREPSFLALLPETSDLGLGAFRADGEIHARSGRIHEHTAEQEPDTPSCARAHRRRAHVRAVRRVPRTFRQTLLCLFQPRAKNWPTIRGACSQPSLQPWRSKVDL